MFGTLISPEISRFENLNGAFSPQNSSLFFVETACQNLKSGNFFSKFSIPNMVLVVDTISDSHKFGQTWGYSFNLTLSGVRRTAVRARIPLISSLVPKSYLS